MRPTASLLATDRALSAAGAGPRPAAGGRAAPPCAPPRLRAAAAPPPLAATPPGKGDPSRPPLPTASDFDADAPPGFWDSPAAGYLSIGLGLGTLVAALAVLLTLAKPVIDTTVDAFPVRGSGRDASAEAGVDRGQGA